MQVEQVRLCSRGEWRGAIPTLRDASLVLVFGARADLAQVIAEVRSRYPAARIAGCSSAGSISGTACLDEGEVVVTALAFASTRVSLAISDLARGERAAGQHLASQLDPVDLSHVFVLAPGVGINGTALVGALHDRLPGVTITGGLAGDGVRMEQTRVVADDTVTDTNVVAVALHGEKLRVGVGCAGGWCPFGPVRRISRSRGNLLDDLDDAPALDLYRRYLGDAAAGLPATGLLFPLQVRLHAEGPGVVRTLLGIESTSGAIRFAGDIPQGWSAQLMTASTTNLLDGAHVAATRCRTGSPGRAAVAFLVSCVGRRMVLGQRTEDELATVHDVLGPIPLAGFYSYGEFGPSGTGAECVLHNQTMTITTLEETA